MKSLLDHAWIPLVVTLIAAVVGIVDHVHGTFGGKPIVISPYGTGQVSSFDSEAVTYEIRGLARTQADISYRDLAARPMRVDGAHSPWALTLTTDAPSTAPHINAQGPGSTITCRIIVDSEVSVERTATGAIAHTFCLVKSA